MTRAAREHDYGFNQQELELARSELKVALTFADYSSVKYSRGELQHAIDAKCKARSLCMRVAARLTGEQKWFAAQ